MHLHMISSCYAYHRDFSWYFVFHPWPLRPCPTRHVGRHRPNLGRARPKERPVFFLKASHAQGPDLSIAPHAAAEGVLGLFVADRGRPAVRPGGNFRLGSITVGRFCNLPFHQARGCKIMPMSREPLRRARSVFSGEFPLG